MENSYQNRSVISQIALIIYDNDETSKKNIQIVLDFIELSNKLLDQEDAVLDDTTQYLLNNLSNLEGKKITGNSKLRKKIEDSQKPFTGDPSPFQELIKKIRKIINLRTQSVKSPSDSSIAQDIIEAITPPLDEELLHNTSLDEIFSAVSGLESTQDINLDRQKKWDEVEKILTKIEKQLNLEDGHPRVPYFTQLYMAETTLLIRDINRTDSEAIFKLLSMTNLVKRYVSEDNETITMLSEYLTKEHQSLTKGHEATNSTDIRKRIEKDILKYLYAPEEPYYE